MSPALASPCPATDTVFVSQSDPIPRRMQPCSRSAAYMLKVLPGVEKLGHASNASSDGGKCGLPAAPKKSPQHRRPDATKRRLASQFRRRFLLAPADANAAISSAEPALSVIRCIFALGPSVSFASSEHPSCDARSLKSSPNLEESAESAARQSASSKALAPVGTNSDGKKRDIPGFPDCPASYHRCSFPQGPALSNWPTA